MKGYYSFGGVAIFVAAAHCASDAAPPATLDAGPIVGSRVELEAGSPVNKFLGIPYAAPPERFGLPKDPKPWEEPLQATEYGAACLQVIASDGDVPNFNGDPPLSEDCLYINAFAPATPGPESGYPVVLFIHGGGFQGGHGRNDLSGFAAYEDIVAFDFNYRTNVFGFPNAPEIPLDERNLGLHDQRLAIQWVQNNAHAFGGDPSKVTIWGQSAGSMSVDIHLGAYARADPPPFRAALMSSGQVSWGALGYTLDPENGDAWNGLAKAVGCGEEPGEGQMGCMRKANSTLLLKQMTKLGAQFMPLKDDVTRESQMAMRWRNGQVAKVPVLTSTVPHEGRTLIGRNTSVDGFMKTYFPDPLVTQEQRDAIVSYYRALPEVGDSFDVVSSIFTDYAWQCPQALLASTSASIDNPTWRFYFNQSVTSILEPRYRWIEKFHGSDIYLLFSTPTFEGDANGVPLTPELYAFANNFRALLGRFVRHPSAGPGWSKVGDERYEPFDVANLGDLGSVSTAGATPVNVTALDARCALYEKLYPVLEKFLG